MTPLGRFRLPTASLRLSIPDETVRRHSFCGSTIRKTPSGVFLMVLPPGIEPGALVPQTNILSIKLREHGVCDIIIVKKDCHYTLE